LVAGPNGALVVDRVAVQVSQPPTLGVREFDEK
jgi:hypothetical protein